MNDIEADSYQWDTPRDSKAPDLKPYAELVKALAEKDREIVKWSELIGSFTRSQHRYLVEMERLEQALAEKEREIQQIREHEFQRGFQEAEEKYLQLMLKAVRFADCMTGCPTPCVGEDYNTCAIGEAQAFLKEHS